MRYLLSTILFLSLGNTVFAEECSKVIYDQVFEKGAGSSGTFANLRGSADSIKARSKTMLERATAAPKARPAEAVCPAECKAPKEPEIVFSTAPSRVRSNYSEEQICAELLEQTSKEPVIFRGKQFPDLDSLNSYFADLCQGSGEDGKVLYQKCPGDCSPRYESSIVMQPVGFVMTTVSVCGHARDKDYGMYDLQTTFRWKCDQSS